jgi:hypothetical protein
VLRRGSLRGFAARDSAQARRVPDNPAACAAGWQPPRPRPSGVHPPAPARRRWGTAAAARRSSPRPHRSRPARRVAGGGGRRGGGPWGCRLHHSQSLARPASAALTMPPDQEESPPLPCVPRQIGSAGTAPPARLKKRLPRAFVWSLVPLATLVSAQAASNCSWGMSLRCRNFTNWGMTPCRMTSSIGGWRSGVKGGRGRAVGSVLGAVGAAGRGPQAGVRAAGGSAGTC